MEIFRLRGTSGEELVLLLADIPDWSRKSVEGGVDFRCTLHLRADPFAVVNAPVWCASGPLFRFDRELRDCYETLAGTARFAMAYERSLEVAVTMTTGGRARILGSVQPNPALKTALTFEFETDQTCFPSVIESLEAFWRYLGTTRPGVTDFV